MGPLRAAALGQLPQVVPQAAPLERRLPVREVRARGGRARHPHDRSAAGAPHRFTYKTIQDAIREAGFEPQLRNQQYEWREIPETIVEQVIDY